MLDLFVLDAETGGKIPADVRPANTVDYAVTKVWQTNWTSEYVDALPNKVALYRRDNEELLGLMSYISDGKLLAVEIIYVESAAHSNANLLHKTRQEKKYIGIAKALFAYAISISKADGYDGVLVFKAKTSELVEYYMKEFGARRVGSYAPFRLVIWEDAAARILSAYWRD
jgi:hypothetical protein